MRPVNIVDKEALKLFSYKKILFAARPNIKRTKAAEMTFYATYFLSSKYIGVLPLLSSESVSGALNHSCHSTTA